MDQKSNVILRAEKEYKNSREKFYLLLREIISNSFHAVMIRQNQVNNYSGRIELNITYDDNHCSIELTDNGDGFTEKNQKYFEELDSRNDEKEKMNFHPLGQGRLAIVYFADCAEYETVYKNSKGVLKKKTIPYPLDSDNLFTFVSFEEEDTTETDSYTKIRVSIRSQQKYNRAKTFFNRCPDVASIKDWIIQTFFPFILNNERITFTVSVNGDKVCITKGSLTKSIEKRDFTIKCDDEEESIRFTLWLISSTEKLRGNNAIICFARNMKAELIGRKMYYTIDSDLGYKLYLTSDYFDGHVDSKGERIEIPESVFLCLKARTKEELDNVFSTEIVKNRQLTKNNLDSFKEAYPSLAGFSSDNELMSGTTVLGEEEILKSAIDNKGRIEKQFWKNKNSHSDEPYTESEEIQKLINSSLHIYIKHRERVLEYLHSLIQKYDTIGNDKPELEKSVHELFLKRGVRLSKSKGINHLHNLWILDDKYTSFSNCKMAQSTKNGQKAADIYIWADDPEKAKEILVFELKSTTHAHNPGEMVSQVKDYASDFFDKPTRYLNWDVATDSVLFNGIILARKEDVVKEIKSNTNSGFKRIPFLKSSYYKDDAFQNPRSDNPTDKIDIRIDVYSFEDIYDLARNRNNVFFKLLNDEYSIIESQ